MRARVAAAARRTASAERGRVTTPAAIAMPASRCAFISALCTLMSSRTNRRLLGQGQPPTCSMPMNMSIAIWSAVALTYAATTRTRSSPEWSRPSGKARTRCASTAVGEGAEGETDGERQRAVRLDERAGEEREPVPIMSAPVDRSGRPRQATRPAPTNERPARIVSAATAVVLSRISPRSIATTPNVAHAAAATPIARPNARGSCLPLRPGVSPRRGHDAHTR